MQCLIHPRSIKYLNQSSRYQNEIVLTAKKIANDKRFSSPNELEISVKRIFTSLIYLFIAILDVFRSACLWNEKREFQTK